MVKVCEKKQKERELKRQSDAAIARTEERCKNFAKLMKHYKILGYQEDGAAQFKEYMGRIGDDSYFTSNLFHINQVAEAVLNAIDTSNKDPLCMYLGFNPVTYQTDIVVETTNGYIFIPLNDNDDSPNHGQVELMGACYSHYINMSACLAQQRISFFLKRLGEMLNLPVIDRFLYGPYILSDWDKEPMGEIFQSEFEFAAQMQAKMIEKYQKQIQEAERIGITKEDIFQSNYYMDYVNQGFSSHYETT